MKVLRVFNVLLLVALIATATVTYTLKHRAELATENIQRLQASIASENDNIRALNAEWALLNQPSRLEAVVDQNADYFQLQPFSPDQIASIDEIPMRGAAAAPGVAAAPAGNDAVKATLARIAAGGALRAR